MEAIVSGGVAPKTTAELAENSPPKTTPKITPSVSPTKTLKNTPIETPTETLKVTPKSTPKTTPVVKVKNNPKIISESVETTSPLPTIVIKEPRQPRILLTKKNDPTEPKTPDILDRTMGRIFGFLEKPKTVNTNEDKAPPGNGSVIAAGAPLFE